MGVVLGFESHKTRRHPGFKEQILSTALYGDRGPLRPKTKLAENQQLQTRPRAVPIPNPIFASGNATRQS
jgi:hypothetical protein